jgi:uncharacterized protein (DUF1778 family)
MVESWTGRSRPTLFFDILPENIRMSGNHVRIMSVHLYTSKKTKKMSAGSVKMARFDTRLPQEQKEFFETVAELGGFRTLTDFLISAAQEKANAIMEKRREMLVSKEDREIFFAALMNPSQPNARLSAAAKRYKNAGRK